MNWKRANTAPLLEDFSVYLCVLCVSVVIGHDTVNHRDTENTEVHRVKLLWDWKTSLPKHCRKS